MYVTRTVYKHSDITYSTTLIVKKLLLDTATLYSYLWFTGWFLGNQNWPQCSLIPWLLCSVVDARDFFVSLVHKKKSPINLEHCHVNLAVETLMKSLEYLF